ncbi:ABC-type transport auxiliary lipoprotein family protein [Thioalkalivibrio sp. ALJ24]|uniref:ABC-type transport auxiliary lipoprotein family protein n=1 Tax=Thioalkalivibrio sp. ALJ24 TaxID=545276 RepID=UPI00037CE8A7|nr:ABC-type transport auxiliary lipoprotein family protein [Thioalkalivibrio sp. ALJ24]
MMRVVLLAVLAAFLLGGCGLLAEREPVDRAWFLLELPEESDAQLADDAAAPVAVELGSVRVAPAYADKGLVYRLGPHEYESDYYNEWFLRPAEQVEQLLRERWTREDGDVRLVDDARAERAAGQPVIELHVLVTALYGDLDAGGEEDIARVGLRARLGGAERAELAHFEAGEPLDRRLPQALVAALSRGMGDTLQGLEAKLEAFARAEAEAS